MSQILIKDVNTWQLSGELTFATVNALLAEFTRQSLEKGKSEGVHHLPHVIDLQNVTRTDSAGLALLVEWRKQTKDTPMTFRNIPAQMQSLATLSGVQDILTCISTSE